MFVYDWNPDLTAGILSAGIVMNTYYIIEEPNQPRLYTGKIFTLDRNEVPSWERDATFNWNESAGRVSDYLQGLSILTPALLMLSPDTRKDAHKIGMMLAETIILNQGITGILKIHTDRKRPFVYFEEAPIGLKYRRQALYSFPSAHTSASAAATFFTASIFSKYFPDSKWKKWMWIGASVLPAAVGILRYEAGRHFLTDIASKDPIIKINKKFIWNFPFILNCQIVNAFI